MKKTSFFRELFNKKPSFEINLDEALFLALMSSIPGQSWYCPLPGQEVLKIGINLPHGTISLNVPSELKELVKKTGASLLPAVPSSSGNTNDVELIKKLITFATR